MCGQSEEVKKIWIQADQPLSPAPSTPVSGSPVWGVSREAENALQLPLCLSSLIHYGRIGRRQMRNAFMLCD